MPNTQAIGVAYADPEFQSVSVIGAVSAASASVSGSLTAGSVSSASVTASGNLFIKSATVAAAGSNQGTAAQRAERWNPHTSAEQYLGQACPAEAQNKEPQQTLFFGVCDRLVQE